MYRGPAGCVVFVVDPLARADMVDGDVGVDASRAGRRIRITGTCGIW